MAKQTPTKARAFTGLIYPDSAPADYRDQLRDSLSMWLLSPLHCPDPIEDLNTGALKTLKLHIHTMYLHSNTITPRLARDIFSRFPWIVIPPKDECFMVSSKANLTRYFLHLDQPEKEQFQGKPEELLTSLNNFPIELERELSRADKRQLKVNCLSLIRDRNITEYNELLNCLMDTQDWELFDFATQNTLMLQGYLAGCRWSGMRAR